jgi:hypothetical protein
MQSRHGTSDCTHMGCVITEPFDGERTRIVSCKKLIDTKVEEKIVSVMHLYYNNNINIIINPPSLKKYLILFKKLK